MFYCSGELSSTLTYAKRDYVWLEGLDWNDSRDGILYMNHYKSKKRTDVIEKSSSIYSVGEIYEVGFNGRVFVFDKLSQKNENRIDNDSPPPYIVRVKKNGDITCTCMASNCKQPQCRHCDVLISILEQGGLDNTFKG
jgi:hypothetical protein